MTAIYLCVPPRRMAHSACSTSARGTATAAARPARAAEIKKLERKCRAGGQPIKPTGRGSAKRCQFLQRKPPTPAARPQMPCRTRPCTHIRPAPAPAHARPSRACPLAGTGGLALAPAPMARLMRCHFGLKRRSPEQPALDATNPTYTATEKKRVSAQRARRRLPGWLGAQQNQRRRIGAGRSPARRSSQVRPWQPT